MRGILLMVRRSLGQHRLSTSVTVLSVALAAGLVMSVFAVNRQARDAFTTGEVGFDAVLGARGSQLQLVLNTVYHLETSPGNLPWSVYQAVEKDPRVTLAVPYAVGDNYRGFRIVGTTLDMFTRFEYSKGRKLEAYPGGRLFDPQRREALIGSVVARRTGLKVGDRINPYHGVTFDEAARHEDEYVVTGVLRTTNTPSDRVVWIPIEGLFRMEGHRLRGTGKEYTAEPGQPIPDEHKEVSAVMIRFRNPKDGFLFEHEVNKQGKVATLAWPIGKVMAELFDKMGWVNRILELVAYLVCLVAAGSILASLYNTMKERRREIAILRALGARRGTVFGAIVLEAGTIAAIGSAIGYMAYAVILLGARTVVRAQTGVELEVWALHPSLWGTSGGMIALGMLAGLLPAWEAYRTDVAENLVPLS